MELEFKKYRKRDIEPTKEGYYFKGKFLNRYLNDSLQILRERIKGLSEEKKIKTKEYKVIRFYYERQTEITKKIHEKKKDYYKTISIRAKQNIILKLNLKIREIEDRKINLIKEFDNRINNIKEEINKLQDG
jgi:hypothetical protein